MKITAEVNLKPFSVPNYVTVEVPARPRQQGVNFDGPKYHLSELSEETLGKLCDQFRDDVFAKAKEPR